jgi:hypothetical protein
VPPDREIDEMYRDHDGDFWWSTIHPRIFLKKSYYEGHRAYLKRGLSKEFLNEIMRDDAYGIRSAWEKGIDRNKNGSEIVKDNVCYGS